MCDMASFVVTKNKVFWLPDNDSHEEIIKYYNLHEGAGRVNFVRVEIVPENYNYRLPYDQWKFKLDQDQIPDWYDKEEVEKRCRIELPEWYEVHVIKFGEHKLFGVIYKIILGGKVEITEQAGGECYFYNDSKGKVTKQIGGYCYFYNNSKGTITEQADGECYFCNNSKGKVTEQIDGSCYFYNNSKGTITEQIGGHCWFYDNSKGIITKQAGGYCYFYNDSKGKVTEQAGGYCRFFNDSIQL